MSFVCLLSHQYLCYALFFSLHTVPTSVSRPFDFYFFHNLSVALITVENGIQHFKVPVKIPVSAEVYKESGKMRDLFSQYTRSF